MSWLNANFFILKRRVSDVSGRPSKYETDVKPKIKFIPTLITAGFSNEDIAEFLNIGHDALYNYKKKYKEFSECFEKKDIAEEVEKTYVNRLLGKYRARKTVKELNRATGQLEVVKEELYEIPFGEGAYKHYLATINPDKWRIKDSSEMLDNQVQLNINIKDLRKKE